MFRDILAALAATVTIIGASGAAPAHAGGRLRDIPVRETGVVTAIAICPPPRAPDRVVANGRIDDPLHRDDRARTVVGKVGARIDDSCARNVDGQIIGNVTIGGNVEIRATRGRSVVAIALTNTTACNSNGAISSERC